MALGESHMLELLHAQAAPPPWADSTMAASLVRGEQWRSGCRH